MGVNLDPLKSDVDETALKSSSECVALHMSVPSTSNSCSIKGHGLFHGSELSGVENGPLRYTEFTAFCF